MDINTADGEQVHFTNTNGYDRERQYAATILTVGVPYTVLSVNVESYSSTVQLAEFPNQLFNTVMFENATEDFQTRDWWGESRDQLYAALEEMRGE